MSMSAADATLLNSRMRMLAPGDPERARIALEAAPELTDRELTLCLAFGLDPTAYLMVRQGDAEVRAAEAEHARYVAERARETAEQRAKIEAYYEAKERGETPPPWW